MIFLTDRRKKMSDRIERAFEQFHSDNPWVYTQLRDMALQLRRAGRNSYGIKALFEVLRYEYAKKTVSDDGLKLNNNFTALYARKLAQSELELREFFEMRIRRPRYVEGQIVALGDAVSPAVDAWDNLI
jgi:hypothetical protein